MIMSNPTSAARPLLVLTACFQLCSGFVPLTRVQSSPYFQQVVTSSAQPFTSHFSTTDGGLEGEVIVEDGSEPSALEMPPSNKFDLETALFCSGLAFDSYVEPPENSSRWERGVCDALLSVCDFQNLILFLTSIVASMFCVVISFF